MTEGWPGSLDGGVISGSFIRTDVDASIGEAFAQEIVDQLALEGLHIAIYVSPTVVDIGRPAECRFWTEFEASGVLQGDDFLAQLDVLGSGDILGTSPTRFIQAFPIWRFAVEGETDVGTWYVSPAVIGQPTHPSADNLMVLQINKWEIGIYSDTNMVAKLASGRLATKQWMTGQKDALYDATGITANSYAPNGRQWSPALAELSRDVFGNVRALLPPPGTPLGTWQTYPIPDRCNIQYGGTNSWGQADTVQSLSDQLDSLIAAPTPSIWYVVAHRVTDDPNDLYSIAPDVFSGFLDYVAAQRDAGNLRVVTVSDSLTPP